MSSVPIFSLYDFRLKTFWVASRDEKMNSIVDTITMIFIVKDTFYLLNHAASFQTEKMNHLFTKEKNKRFFSKSLIF